MNILDIPLDDIDPGDRLRDVDADYAALIAASMADHGQMTPLEVRATPSGAKPYSLIFGGHRLAALRLAGIPFAKAQLYTGTDMQARLREIDENLIRHELTQLDRSTFLAMRKKIWEELYPQTRHGGDRSEQVAKFAADRFTSHAADRLGFSERAIRLALTRHKRLHPDVRRKLAGTWLADHGAQLDALSKAPPSEQLQVVALLFGPVAEGIARPRTVAEALGEVRGAAPQAAMPDERVFQGFLRLWRLAPSRVQRRIREWIKAEGKA